MKNGNTGNAWFLSTGFSGYGGLHLIVRYDPKFTTATLPNKKGCFFQNSPFSIVPWLNLCTAYESGGEHLPEFIEFAIMLQ